MFIWQKVVAVAFVFCGLMLVPSCHSVSALTPVSANSSSNDVVPSEEVVSSATNLAPTAHLSGTLLRDETNRFWLVSPWLERLSVTADDLSHSFQGLDSAILMTAQEENCLADSGRAWHGQEGWELIRLEHGEFWYIDQIRGYRRSARPEVMQARHDDPESASRLVTTLLAWEAGYRDLGTMPLPNGVFVRNGDGLFYFYGAMFRRIDEALALEMGYDTSRAVSLLRNEFWRYGAVADAVTHETFTACPATIPRGHRDDDEDEDGMTVEFDCDDADPSAGPGFAETCDGIDNDCDGVADNGFHVGYQCRLDDGCQMLGVTQCSRDEQSVVCRADEVGCQAEE